MIAHGVVATEETDCNRKQGPRECSLMVKCCPSKSEMGFRLPLLAPLHICLVAIR